MKVKVNEDACIGCGACAAIAPEVFEINDEGLSTVIVDEVAKENEEEAMMLSTHVQQVLSKEKIKVTSVTFLL